MTKEIQENTKAIIKAGQAIVDFDKDYAKANIGHNSRDKEKIGQGIINKNTSELLKKYIENIEYCEDQKKGISRDIREIFDEAKSAGFDVKTMRKIISLRKVETAKLEEQEFLLQTYQEALTIASQPDLFSRKGGEDED